MTQFFGCDALELLPRYWWMGRAQSDDWHSRWWKSTINTFCEWIGRNLQKVSWYTEWESLRYVGNVFGMLRKSTICSILDSEKAMNLDRIHKSADRAQKSGAYFLQKSLRNIIFVSTPSLCQKSSAFPRSLSFRSTVDHLSRAPYIISICLTKTRSILLIFGYNFASKCFLDWTFSLYAPSL